MFAVAECDPNYANPVKDCALIMAAEGDAPDDWKPAIDYYDALTSFLKWHDCGKVLAGGVLNAGAVADKPVVEEAKKFGASL